MAGVRGPLPSVLYRMAEVGQMYKQCAELTEVVNPIKDVNRKYRQVSGLFLLLAPPMTRLLLHPLRVHSFQIMPASPVPVAVSYKPPPPTSTTSSVFLLV